MTAEKIEIEEKKLPKDLKDLEIKLDLSADKITKFTDKDGREKIKSNEETIKTTNKEGKVVDKTRKTVEIKAKIIFEPKEEQSNYEEEYNQKAKEILSTYFKETKNKGDNDYEKKVELTGELKENEW